MGSDDYLYAGRKLKISENAENEAQASEKVPINVEIPTDLLEPNLVRLRSNSMQEIQAPLMKNQNQYTNGRKESDDVKNIHKGSFGSLRDKISSSLAKGGDISDIDKIFEHALNESKRVNESLKQVNEHDEHHDLRKSFLKFYETASKGSIDDEMYNFIACESESQVMKSEAYYCTKHGRVKGILTIADTYIMYDPLYCEENNKFKQESLATKFQA